MENLQPQDIQQLKNTIKTLLEKQSLATYTTIHSGNILESIKHLHAYKDKTKDELVAFTTIYILEYDHRNNTDILNRIVEVLWIAIHPKYPEDPSILW